MERVTQLLRFDQGFRFFFLYGPGVTATFLTTDYAELDLEQVLWHALKKEGFERIVYCSSGSPGVYFRDQESFESFRGRRQPAGVQGPQSMKYFRGPLGDRLLIAPPRQEVLPQGPGIGDTHALSLLDAFMRDKTCRTALIFVNAQDYFRHVENRRALDDCMTRWLNLYSTNRNVCILLSPTQNTGEMSNWLQAFPPALSDAIRNKSGCSVIRIGEPEKEELKRALHYVRLKDRVKVNVREIDRLAAWMAAESRAGGKPLSQWLRLMKTSEEIGIESARKKGWFKSVSTDTSSAWERLDGLVGLKEVKEWVRQWADTVKVEMERQRQGLVQGTAPPTLHMVFYGNPGTGKTTVARLIGEILRDLGLLRVGHTVEAKISELVAGFVGQTAIQTNQKIDQALDGVLFIDEAYQLADPERGKFGQEAIDTLLPRMENDRDRLVVIVAGYTEPMKKFLESNEGLSSRIPEGNRVEFPDYSAEELKEILFRMLRERGLSWTSEAEGKLGEVVEGLYQARDEKFGNAREMRNLAEAVYRQWASRVAQQGLEVTAPIGPEDIPEAYRRYLPPPVPELDEVLAELNGLVGLKTVKEFVTELVARMRLEQMQRQAGRHVEPPTLHMVFLGNPGTGKTTVARLMGDIFRILGFLKRGHVVEVGRDKLVAGYVGQTAPTVKERLKEALDGVLFIDEAYALAEGGTGDFGKEAINTLTDWMEKYRDRLAVIVAGYPDKMEEFFQTNPGLRSRFVHKVGFPDYTDEELTEILRRMAEREGYGFTPEALEAARRYLQARKQANPKEFGNAREVRNLLDLMKNRLARRVLGPAGHQAELPEQLFFTEEDVPPIAGEPVQERPVAERSVGERRAQFFDLVSRLPDKPGGSSLEEVRRAVVFVRVEGRESGSGTGFLVTPDGLLLTAYHVVKGGERFYVSFEEEPEVMIEAEVVGWDAEADIAVLRICEEGVQYPYCGLAESGYKPRLGEEVCVLSYPLGERIGREISYTKGTVSSVRDWQGVKVIQTDAGAAEGCSGAPLFRLSDFRVIGIIHGGVRPEIAAGLNFAVSVQEVYRRFRKKRFRGPIA